VGGAATRWIPLGDHDGLAGSGGLSSTPDHGAELGSSTLAGRLVPMVVFARVRVVDSLEGVLSGRR